MTDNNEQSIPSRGSHGPAIAWALLRADGSVAACHELLSLIESVARGQPIVPLCRLTDDERAAIAWAVNKTAQSYDDAEGGPIKREAMRGLLQRTK